MNPATPDWTTVGAPVLVSDHVNPLILTVGVVRLPDIGVFSVAGPAVGFNIGVSALVGYARGGIDDFRGRTANLDVSIGPVAVTASIVPNGTSSSFAGAAIGIGISPTVGGVDISSTTTKAGGLFENVFVPIVRESLDLLTGRTQSMGQQTQGSCP